MNPLPFFHYSTTRRSQLTLFVPPPAKTLLEAVRVEVDPVQHGLIAAHVTLCREDELAGLEEEAFRSRLWDPRAREIRLEFGPAETFSTHGLWLPCVRGAEAFQVLRRHLLGREDIRQAQAHITLAHPRNPRAEKNSLAAASRIPGGLSIHFPVVSLIEQNHGGKLEVREEFPLHANS